jgi:MFS family permease
MSYFYVIAVCHSQCNNFYVIAGIKNPESFFVGILFMSGGNIMFKLINSTRCLPYVIFSLAASFLFFEMALQISPGIMVDDLMRDIHLDASGLGIMASVYYYSYTLMQIPAGLLFDHLSSRKLITFSMLLCVAGAVFFGCSQTSYMAAMGRFLMGLGSAFAFISVLFVASQWFSARYFALLAGIAQLLAACGAIGGEGPLASIVMKVGWRTTMYWLAAVGLLIAGLAWLIVRDPRKNTISVQPFNELVVTGLKKLCFVLTNKQMWVIALYSFAVWAPIVSFAALWGVPYLSKYYSIDREIAASACSMIWLGVGLGSVYIGWLSDKLGKRKPPLLCCALLGLLVSILIVYVPNINLSWMFVLLFLLGISSSGQALSFAVVKDNNHAFVTGTAVGFNNMAVVAGGALFQPLVGILLYHHSKGLIIHNTFVYMLSDYRHAFIVLPLCYLLSLISLIYMHETNCKNQFLTLAITEQMASNQYDTILKVANIGH